MQNKILVFDVDNTLYYAGDKVEDEVNIKRNLFFMEKLHLSEDEALGFISKIRKNNLYEVEAITDDMPFTKQEFMDDVCDVDVSFLPRNKKLNELLKKLPQRKFIITDSIIKHVHDVLKAINVDEDNFEDIFDGHAMNYTFKHDPQCFVNFLRRYNLKAQDCLLFEDNLDNLCAAKSVGLATVLITPEPTKKHPFVDQSFPDIVTALATLTK